MKKHLLYLVVLSLVGYVAQAQRYKETDKVFPTPDPTTEGRKFGTSVAIDGDYAAVSDPVEGAVSVLFYEADQWRSIAKLSYPKSPAQYAARGVVDIKGDVIAVAAPHVGSPGTVFVFEKPAGGWTDTEALAKLTPNTEGENGSIFSTFGTSVSVTDAGILVGSERSVAYLFQRPGEQWMDMTQTASLTPAVNTDQYDRFGRNVCFLDSVALVSADGLNSSRGGVFAFRRPSTGWSNLSSASLITATDGETGDSFGSSIDALPGHVVIGAPRADRNGAVYVFDGTLTSNSQQAKLTNPDGFYDGLGISVSTSYRTIVAGTRNKRHVCVYELALDESTWKDATPTATLAEVNPAGYSGYSVSIRPSDDIILTSTPDHEKGGVVYSYQKPKDGWIDMSHTQMMNATLKVSAAFDYFGSHLAIDGDYAVVASPGDDEMATNAGMAYVFHRRNGQWDKVARLTLSNPDPESVLIRNVAISGNTIVVSYDQRDQLAAFVYTKPASGWQDMTESAVLSTELSSESYSTIHSVAIDGSTIAMNVGVGYNAQLVMVYEKPTGGWTNMTQTATLTGGNNQYIAGGKISTIALSGNTIAVGAAGEASYQGAVYVFARPDEGWRDMNPTARLTASDGVSDDGLGTVVDIWGNTIVAGTSGRSYEREAVFVFEKLLSGWDDATETARLTRRSNKGHSMGYEVAIVDSTIVIDANGEVLIYQKPMRGWINMVESTRIASGPSYIRAVDVSDSTIMVGNWQDNTQGTEAGTVLCYTLQPNNPPVLARSITDQNVVVRSQFTFTINEGSFSDNDGDDISYLATLADGSPLPAWLSFNENTFDGKPMAEDVGKLNIKVTATDGYDEVSTVFTVTVREEAIENPTDETEEEPTDEGPEEPTDTEEPPVLGEDMVTGIDDEANEPEVRLYPNPSVGQVYVQSESEAIQRVTLSNGQGQIMMDYQYTSKRNGITLNTLLPGIYQVRIQTEHRVINRRVIVR